MRRCARPHAADPLAEDLETRACVKHSRGVLVAREDGRLDKNDRTERHVGRKRQPLREVPKGPDQNRLTLFLLFAATTTRTTLFEHDSTGRSLLSLRLLSGHRLVDPGVSLFQQLLTLRWVVAGKVGLFAVDEVEVGHGIVVVLTKLKCLLQVLAAFLDLVHVGGTKLVTDLP